MGATADDARQSFSFGDLVFCTLAPSVFSGGMSVFSVELAPRCLSGPLHVHDREDGLSYVLEGRLTFMVGREISTVAAGEVVALPRGVPHTFWNPSSDPAKALDIVAPGGLEDYYERLAGVADAPDVMDQLVMMEGEFGIHMDWDSIPVLTAQHGLRMVGG